MSGQRGRPKNPDPTPRMTTAIRFPTAMHDRLAAEAEDRDLSINFLVVKACGEFLDRLIPADEIQWTRERES